jgi:membrane protein DedA with SNARE-associated domain/rhodanese-related sulfurtransferase
LRVEGGVVNSILQPMQMNIDQILVSYGLPLVFGAVFVEQIGVPLPAIPWLLAVGALAAGGNSSATLAIGLTVIACLVADAIWFYLGRYRGTRVLGFLCRVSLEPDSCVRRTQNMFTRYGLRSLVVAKFLPGFLSTVAPPLAGMSKMKISRFLFFDSLGSLLYAICFVMLGYSFSHQIKQITDALSSIGGKALGLLAILAGTYIGIKYWQRRRILRELRMARITVSDLRQKQKAGEALTILDLRSSAALEEDPAIIPGAIRTSLDDIKSGNYQVPRDKEVVVYCSCPNEETAARVTLLLQRSGFKNVRPLLGGIDAWREQNYPIEKAAPIVLSAVAPGSVNLAAAAMQVDAARSSGSSTKRARNGSK